MFYCIEAVQFTCSAQTKKLVFYCIEAVQFAFSAQTKNSCSIVLKQYSLHLVHRQKTHVLLY